MTDEAGDAVAVLEATTPWTAHGAQRAQTPIGDPDDEDWDDGDDDDDEDDEEPMQLAAGQRAISRD
jgi:hypothetical protein